MFSSITSRVKASISDVLQQTPQHNPTSQQNYNAAPQVLAPWTAQYMPQYSCWLYVNSVTHQQSWIHPSQLQPQPHTGYQANAFPSPSPQQAQNGNDYHTVVPTQQQWSHVPINPSPFLAPSQQPQQSSIGPQPSRLPFQSQRVNLPFSAPQPQHTQLGYHGQ
jgi:hypothetical protein